MKRSKCFKRIDLTFEDRKSAQEVQLFKGGDVSTVLRPSNGKKFTTTHPPKKNNMSPPKSGPFPKEISFFQPLIFRGCVSFCRVLVLLLRLYQMHRGPAAASPIGLMAAQVTLIGRLMPREDDEVRQVMAQVFQRASQLCSIPFHPTKKERKNNLHQNLQPK